MQIRAFNRILLTLFDKEIVMKLFFNNLLFVTFFLFLLCFEIKVLEEENDDTLFMDIFMMILSLWIIVSHLIVLFLQF